MNANQTPAPEITIRPATPADVEQLIAITGEVFAPVSIDAMIEKNLGKPASSWVEIKGSVIRREMQQNPQGCFVAQMEGQVVGYVTTVVNRMASRGVIANLAVTKKAQNRGLGRRLLEHAIEHFRKIGLAQAKIETLACNEAGQRLYPSLGFKELVRQIHYVMPLK